MIASLAALYLAGLVTFVSPCTLPMLPFYLAAIGGESDGTTGRANGRLVRAGLGFAAGLGVVFVALGVAWSALAGVVGAHRGAISIGGGILVALAGAKLLGIVKLPWADREARPFFARVRAGGGFVGGAMFGAAFAIGWTPCVGPALAAALAYAASSGASSAIAGAQLASFAAGLATPLVAATFAAPHVLALARRLRGAAVVMQRATGAALLVVGAVLAYGGFTRVADAAPEASLEGDRCAGSEGACAYDPRRAAGPSAELAKLDGEPRLLEFVSGHCEVCKRMAPVVEDVQKRCAAGAGAVQQVSVDDAHGEALAARYGVRAVPTFIAVDAEGSEVERFVGEHPRERIALAVSAIRGEACTVTQ